MRSSAPLPGSSVSSPAPPKRTSSPPPSWQRVVAIAAVHDVVAAGCSHVSHRQHRRTQDRCRRLRRSRRCPSGRVCSQHLRCHPASSAPYRCRRRYSRTDIRLEKTDFTSVDITRSAVVRDSDNDVLICVLGEQWIPENSFDVRPVELAIVLCTESMQKELVVVYVAKKTFQILSIIYISVFDVGDIDNEFSDRTERWVSGITEIQLRIKLDVKFGSVVVPSRRSEPCPRSGRFLRRSLE